MGIETILIVGLLVIIVGIFTGLGRAKRKARRNSTANPPTAPTGPRQ